MRESRNNFMSIIGNMSYDAKKLKIFSDDFIQHNTPEKEKEYKITKKNTINNYRVCYI